MCERRRDGEHDADNETVVGGRGGAKVGCDDRPDVVDCMMLLGE